MVDRKFFFFFNHLTKANHPAVPAWQERLVSGVGNWVADEVCYQACVHPAAKCNTLSPEQVKSTFMIGTWKGDVLTIIDGILCPGVVSAT